MGSTTEGMAAGKEMDPRPAARGRLRLTCSKCTRYREFSGGTVEQAGAEAERKGWRKRAGKVVCNRCPH